MEIKGNIVDIHQNRIYPSTLKFFNGKLSEIQKLTRKQNHYLIPGFIDSHIHIESTLITPCEFARIALQHGTVAVVSDPHEIANVLGLDGVYFMISNAKQSPLKFYFSAPSCVPATPLETSGASLGITELEILLKDNRIKYLGEMMNYPGIINKDESVLAKINLAQSFGKPVDGHAPGLRGSSLQKYIAAGISTDHETGEYMEGLEKLKLGMNLLIREGSASRNFSTLIPLVRDYPEQCMFCCDDLHPDDLLKGHINLLVKRALEQGLNIFTVLRAASLNPIKHYGLDVGLLRPGDEADFLVVDNLHDLNILQTWIQGREVRTQSQDITCHLEIPEQKFNIRLKSPADFQMINRNLETPAIVVQDGSIITRKTAVRARTENSLIVTDPERDLLKLSVVNRYRDAAPAVALVQGFGLTEGALASSVAHDSHNIIAVGADDLSLARAVNLVIQNQGGLCLVSAKEEMILPLPVAGLMSTLSCEEAASKYRELEMKARNLGTKLTASFMTLSFLALIVIPELKLSDRGLFDVDKFKFIDP
ncbi:MAG: adenine deaminase [Candidatus Cloacimonetes bacterium]|nr:adenine deaminase [Candidatus Cloacimonadota bacterium]